MGRPGCGCCDDKCATTFKYDKETGELLWKKNLGLNTSAVCEHNGKIYVYVNESLFSTQNPKRKSPEDVKLDTVELVGDGEFGVKVTAERHLLEEEQEIIVTGVTDSNLERNFYITEVIDENTFIFSSLTGDSFNKINNNLAYRELIKPERYLRRIAGLTIISNYDILVLDLDGNIIVDECIQFMPPFEMIRFESNSTFNPNDNEVTIFGYKDDIYVTLYGEEFAAGTFKINTKQKKIVGVLPGVPLNKKNANPLVDGNIFYCGAGTICEIDNLTYKITYQETVNELSSDYPLPYSIPFVNWGLRLTYFDVNKFAMNDISLNSTMTKEQTDEHAIITEGKGYITIKLHEKYNGITFLPQPFADYGFLEYEEEPEPGEEEGTIKRVTVSDFVSNVIKRPRFGSPDWEDSYSGIVDQANSKMGVNFRTDNNVVDVYNQIQNKNLPSYNDVVRNEYNLDNNTFKVKYLKPFEFGGTLEDANDLMLEQLRFSLYKENNKIVSNEVNSGIVHHISIGYNFPVFDAMYYVNNQNRVSDTVIREYSNWVEQNGDNTVYYKPINYEPGIINIDSKKKINGSVTLNYASYAPYYNAINSGDIRYNAFDSSYDYEVEDRYKGYNPNIPESGHVISSGHVVSNEIDIVKFLSPFGRFFNNIGAVPPAANIILGYDAPGIVASNFDIQNTNTSYSYYTSPASFPAECNYFRKNNGLTYKLVSQDYIEDMSNKSDSKGNLRYVSATVGYPYSYYGAAYYNNYGNSFVGLDASYSYYNLYNGLYNYYSDYTLWSNGYNYFHDISMSVIKNQYAPMTYNSALYAGYNIIQSDGINFDFVNDFKQSEFPDIHNIVQDSEEIFINGDTTTVSWDIDGGDYFVTDTSNSGFKETPGSIKVFRNSSTTQVLSPNTVSIMSYRYDDEIRNPSGHLTYIKNTFKIAGMFGIGNFVKSESKEVIVDLTKIDTQTTARHLRDMSGLNVSAIGNNKLIDKKYMSVIIEGDDDPIKYESQYSFIQLIGDRVYLSKETTLSDGTPFTSGNTGLSFILKTPEDIVFAANMNIMEGGPVSILNYNISPNTNRAPLRFVPFPSGIAPSGFPDEQIVFAYGQSGIAENLSEGTFTLNAEDNFITGPNRAPYYYSNVGEPLNHVHSVAFYGNQQYLVGGPLLEKELISNSGGLKSFDRASDTNVDYIYGPSGLWDASPVGEVSGIASFSKVVNFRYMAPETITLVNNFVPLFRSNNGVPLFNEQNLKQFPYDNYGYSYIVNDLLPAVPHGREYLGLLFGLDVDTMTIVVKHVQKTDTGVTLSPASVTLQCLEDISDTEFHTHEATMRVSINANEIRRFNVHRYGTKTWDSRYLPDPVNFNYEQPWGNNGRDFISNQTKAMRDSFITKDHLYLTGNKVRFTNPNVTSNIDYSKKQARVASQDCFEDRTSELSKTLEVTYSSALGKLPGDSGNV